MVGLPCNQFGGQEPGSADEIAEFCSATYGVTFPMTEKIDVNGDDRHPLYAALVASPDEKGPAGDVDVELREVPGRRATAGSSPASTPASSPTTPAMVAAIEAQLA